MGNKYLVDTNVAVDFLDNKLPQKANTFLENGEIYISVITRIELLGWNGISPKQLVTLSSFISYATEINLEEDVVQTTIFLRKKHKIKLPDALIAATAIAKGFILVSRNEKDFSKISELQFANPYKIN
jgi:predicted nucleic acid-binding protein